MPIEIIVRADGSQAEAALRKFFSNTRNEADRTQNHVRSKFKNIAISMVQDFAGPTSQVAGMLARIQHPAAIAAAAITGLAGAFVLMANRAAEANREGSAEARKFLTGVQNLKAGFDELVNTIGQKVIPVINFLFEKFGINTEKAKLTTAQTKELKQAQKEWAEESRKAFDEFDRGIKAAFEAGNIEALRELDEKILAFARNTKVVAGQLLFVSDEIYLLARNAELLKNILEGQAKDEAYIKYWQGVNKQMDEWTRKLEEGLQKSIEADDAAGELIQKSNDRQDEINENLVREQQLRNQINSTLQSSITSLAQAAMYGQSFADVLKSIIFSFVQLGISRFIPFLGENGLVAMQHGAIVRRPTPALIGENGPEAVVPLSPNKTQQRNEIMQAAGLSGGGNVTLNISMPNVRMVDPLAIRNDLLPAINKQIRRGERLLASKLR